jgi:hypothetical protein
MRRALIPSDPGHPPHFPSGQKFLDASHPALRRKQPAVSFFYSFHHSHDITG